MKRILLFVIILFSAVACKKAEIQKFNLERASVYFYINKDQTLNVILKSFAATTQPELTVEVPVRCSGIAADHDRYFKVKIVDTLTTAIAGIDYKTFSPECLFPAGAYEATIKVVVNKSEAALTQYLNLTLEIVESPEFLVGDKYRKLMTIRFSDLLERPANWEDINLGLWSRVKHLKYLEIIEREEFPNEVEYATNNYFYTKVAARQLKQYYQDHYPQMDEHGNTIEIW